MKILIYSLGKSGTTALLYTISKAYDGELKSYFEPANLNSINYHLEDVIVKSVYANRWETDQDYFSAFDKKILLVRNPLDRIVSYLLYMPYNGDGFSKDKNAQEYCDYLKLIVSGSETASIRKLDDLYVKITKRTSLIKVAINQSLSILNLAKKIGSNFLILRYEDFVDCNHGELNKYLEFEVSETIAVGKKYKRTKRAGKYDDYLKFFSKDEVEDISKQLYDFFSYFNYQLKSDKVNLPTAKNTYEYVTNVINEYRTKHGIRTFKDGRDSVGMEGELFDRARRLAKENNKDLALKYLEDSLTINPKFNASIQLIERLKRP